jgi:hypothetical protein
MRVTAGGLSDFLYYAELLIRSAFNSLIDQSHGLKGRATQINIFFTYHQGHPPAAYGAPPLRASYGPYREMRFPGL